MRLLRWALITMLFSAVLAIAIAVASVKSGFTPGRWLDYMDRRLEGHPNLESVAHPVMNVVRWALDEPSRAERFAQPFYAPPPPPRWHGTEQAPEKSDIPGHKVWLVGKGLEYNSIAKIAKLARDGDTVEVMAGDYHGDVALWLQKRLTLRSVGGNARLFADGNSAEGKAIWVIRDGVFDIEGFDFIGAKVQDRNGAGIRFEGGQLIVRRCLFWDSESGILATPGDQSRSSLRIENSEFGYLGDGEGRAHSIYTGDLALLEVQGNYFHHGNVGHLIKSRARASIISYNRITDEDGRASYEVDISNGGLAVVVGNLVQQSRRTENSTLIRFGAEGYPDSESRLYVASNTLVNDHPYGGAFVRASAGAKSVVVVNNVLVGIGDFHAEPALQASSNPRLPRSAFQAPEQWNFSIRPEAISQDLVPSTPAIPDVAGTPLTPTFQYAHPRRIQSLGPASRRVVGAFQSN